MAKQLIKVALHGINSAGRRAKTHQANDVQSFRSVNGKVQAQYVGGTVHLATPKGVTELTKHTSNNYWSATINGTKVQLSLKKIVGELRYWAEA